MFKEILRQIRKFIPLFLILLIPVIMLVGFVFIVSVKTGQPIVVFFQDIFYQTHVPLYVGFISNIGMIVWSFAVAVCLFMSFILISIKRYYDNFFFLSAAFLGTVLLLDDFFMFHEIIYPRYFHFGSDVAYIIYAAMGITFLIMFRKIILNSDFIIFLMALALFATSIFFDELRESFSLSDYWIIAEDGSKLLGVIYWTVYFAITGKKFILSSDRVVNLKQ
jgi:hypothetical protein